MHPPPLSRSELEGGEPGLGERDTLVPPPPPVPSEAAPKKRPGRPKGVKNGQGQAKPAKKKAQAKPAKKVVAAAPKKKTVARAAAPAAAAAAAKPAKETKPQRLARVRSKELEDQAANGSVDAPKLLKAIQKAHGKWQNAIAAKSTVAQECKERLQAANAAFQNAIESPLDATRVETLAYKGKLELVEQRWQDLSEAKAQNIEEKKNVRDDIKAALAAMNEAVEESRQQRLPGVA